jgi:hypothetical protein
LSFQACVRRRVGQDEAFVGAELAHGFQRTDWVDSRSR